MHAALARAHCEKRRKYHVRTYHVPTHPARCLGTSVPRQKINCNKVGGMIDTSGVPIFAYIDILYRFPMVYTISIRSAHNSIFIHYATTHALLLVLVFG